MGKAFAEAEGKVIVDRLIDVIHENRAYLSEVDGAIGDGDHGINMNKGFMMVKKKLEGQDDIGMSEALKQLGRTLVEEIGGSMGPLYGMFFRKMARASKGKDKIDTAVLKEMLASAYDGVSDLGNAKPGDKTLMDTLDPAVKAVEAADTAGKPLDEAVDDMIAAAEKGWKSTEDMVAKVGRASRLGERSRGALDAGATSCYLLLKAMGETMKELSA
jgi:dihydroxyacetone kinase-like protein